MNTKNFEIKKEMLIWVVMILPVLYLINVWSVLPEIVPTHFGIDGKPNDWSNKSVLIYSVTGMLFGIYLLLTIIPAIDPKGKITAMGKKYFLLKLFLMLFMSLFCFFMIQAAQATSLGSPHTLFALLGALFVFLGNYMQSIKPNYFIGIRTPWTLENEVVWRKTHQLGGKLYFAAGLLAMILPFILKGNFEYIFLGLILSASLISVVYSFMVFKQEKLNDAG